MFRVLHFLFLGFPMFDMTFMPSYCGCNLEDYSNARIRFPVVMGVPTYSTCPIVRPSLINSLWQPNESVRFRRLLNDWSICPSLSLKAVLVVPRSWLVRRPERTRCEAG